MPRVRQTTFNRAAVGAWSSAYPVNSVTITPINWPNWPRRVKYRPRIRPGTKSAIQATQIGVFICPASHITANNTSNPCHCQPAGNSQGIAAIGSHSNR